MRVESPLPAELARYLAALDVQYASATRRG